MSQCSRFWRLTKNGFLLARHLKGYQLECDVNVNHAFRQRTSEVPAVCSLLPLHMSASWLTYANAQLEQSDDVLEKLYFLPPSTFPLNQADYFLCTFASTHSMRGGVSTTSVGHRQAWQQRCADAFGTADHICCILISKGFLGFRLYYMASKFLISKVTSISELASRFFCSFPGPILPFWRTISNALLLYHCLRRNKAIQISLLATCTSRPAFTGNPYIGLLHLNLFLHCFTRPCSVQRSIARFHFQAHFLQAPLENVRETFYCNINLNRASRCKHVLDQLVVCSHLPPTKPILKTSVNYIIDSWLFFSLHPIIIDLYLRSEFVPFAQRFAHPAMVHF